MGTVVVIDESLVDVTFKLAVYLSASPLLIRGG